MKNGRITLFTLALLVSLSTANGIMSDFAIESIVIKIVLFVLAVIAAIATVQVFEDYVKELSQ